MLPSHRSLVGEASQRDCVSCHLPQLDDREGVRRKPPPRLESLRASKTQSVPSREKFEEKMRLAEKRRKVCVGVWLNTSLPSLCAPSRSLFVFFLFVVFPLS